MKKKLLFSLFGGGIALTAAVVTLASTGSVAIKALGTDTGDWQHYAAIKATESNPGSREYWINCNGGEIAYSKPDSEHISEGSTSNEEIISYLKDNDKDYRYTYYTPNALKSEGSFWRYFRHAGWGSSDFANGIVKIKTNFTITYSLISDAHELGYKYIYFHMDATTKESADKSIGSVVLTTHNTDAKFSTGNDWLQVNLPTGITINVDDFYGKYKGDGYSDGAYIFATEFRDEDNADANSLVEDVTISNFKLFNNEESLNAYKNMDTVLTTAEGGWRYYHFGAWGTTSNPRTLEFKCGNGAFTMTSNLVEDMAKAGATKFSFNLKVVSELGANLGTVVYTTGGGTDKDGAALEWNTCWDQKDIDSNELASNGLRISMDISKLIGATFASETAFEFQIRLAGSESRYEVSGDTLTYTVSDLIIA